MIIKVYKHGKRLIICKPFDGWKVFENEMNFTQRPFPTLILNITKQSKGLWPTYQKDLQVRQYDIIFHPK